VEGFHGVGAGEKDPVEGVEAGERGVEGGEGGGVGQLDGGDEDGLGTEGAELVGERGGLVGGAGDEDAGGHEVIRAERQAMSSAGSRGEQCVVVLEGCGLVRLGFGFNLVSCCGQEARMELENLFELLFLVLFELVLLYPRGC
jgi:hypothetical protein